MLDEELIQLCKLEKRIIFLYGHKGNALNRKINEMKSGTKGVEAALQTLQEERKKSHVNYEQWVWY